MGFLLGALGNSQIVATAINVVIGLWTFSIGTLLIISCCYGILFSNSIVNLLYPLILGYIYLIFGIIHVYAGKLIYKLDWDAKLVGLAANVLLIFMIAPIFQIYIIALCLISSILLSRYTPWKYQV